MTAASENQSLSPPDTEPSGEPSPDVSHAYARLVRQRLARVRTAAKIPTRLHRLLNHSRSLEGMAIAALALGMVTSLVIARSVGPAGRGSIITLVVWAQILGWTASFSFDNAIVVLSRTDATGTLDPDVALAWSRKRVAILSGPVFAVSFLLGLHFFHDLIWALMLSFGALVTAQGQLSAGWLLAKGRRVSFVLYRLGQPLCYFIGCTSIAEALRSSDHRIRLLALAIGVFVSLILPVIAVTLLTPLHVRVGGIGRRMASFAASAQVANVLQYLNSRLDILALSLLTSPRQVGLYSVGLATGQATVLLGNASSIRGITGADTKLDVKGIIGTASIGAIVAAVSPFAIPFLFGHVFEPSVRVAQIIAIGGTANYALQSSSGRLLGAGRPWLMALGEGCGTIAFAAGIAVSRSLDFVAAASVASYVISFGIAQLCLARVHASGGGSVLQTPAFPE
jgi:O-antigen/teichoic acid export membrane protein